MEIHQLTTFVAVAGEGSITRAAERVHLSQPAVSAHIKALEDVVGTALFERTSRGMTLTSAGETLLVKAEQTLRAHRDLMAEALRLSGRIGGKVRLGAGSNTRAKAIGLLVGALSKRCPDVDVELVHDSSAHLVEGIRNGTLDAVFYNEAGAPGPELATFELARFGVYLAARPGLVAPARPLDWQALAELSWVCPPSTTCCGQLAERLFSTHATRPKKIIGVDREDVIGALLAQGAGVGLLHAETAEAARTRGEVELVHELPGAVRVLFAHLARRAGEPLFGVMSAIVRGE